VHESYQKLRAYENFRSEFLFVKEESTCLKIKHAPCLLEIPANGNVSMPLGSKRMHLDTVLTARPGGAGWQPAVSPMGKRQCRAPARPLPLA
jgi:hypothetical protein